MTDRTLDWRHNAAGARQYRAIDTFSPGSPVYIVSRDPEGNTARPWMLSVTVPGDQAPQVRTEFHDVHAAQVAALNTRCHVCFRVLPFALLRSSGSNGGWRCRNLDDCAAAEAEREAEEDRVRREIRNTDMEELGVNDTADGPVLVFVTAGTGNRVTVECTGTDLFRLEMTLRRRRLAQARAELRELVRLADEVLARHETEEGNP